MQKGKEFLIPFYKLCLVLMLISIPFLLGIKAKKPIDKGRVSCTKS